LIIWRGSGVLSPLMIGLIIQASVVVVLCVGFTFTYMMEKFPNFAHTSLATISIVISYTLVQMYGFTPYQALPVSALICGLIGLMLYRFIVRPIKATGAREITLTFAFFALTEVIASIMYIYSYWYLYNRGTPTSGFYFFTGDFTWEGYPGVLLVAAPICCLLVVALWLFLTKVKQGIAFRAVAEDETLASSLGVNVEEIHLLTWFITGALAGLAGGIIPLWRYTGLDANDEFLILVMTGSVVGGLNTVAGAVVGGLIVVVAQKLLTFIGIDFFGVGAAMYESLYPMVLVVIILFLQPEGVMGAFDKSRPAEKRLTVRLRDSYRNLKRKARELRKIKITLYQR
jgi:branched-chain amino acid transport system permease protein